MIEPGHPRLSVARQCELVSISRSGEQDLVTRPFNITAIEKMVCDGIIKDATTIAALGLLKLKGMI